MLKTEDNGYISKSISPIGILNIRCIGIGQKLDRSDYVSHKLVLLSRVSRMQALQAWNENLGDSEHFTTKAITVYLKVNQEFNFKTWELFSDYSICINSETYEPTRKGA